MSSEERRDRMNEGVLDESIDPTLQAALLEFRQTVQAWSDEEYARPRRVVQPATRHGLTRRSLAWALGLIVAVGAGSGAVYERHHQQELAKQEAQRQAEQQRVLAQKHAQETDLLLANIETDVSREVPSAMEPLAQMMTDDSQ